MPRCGRHPLRVPSLHDWLCRLWLAYRKVLHDGSSCGTVDFSHPRPLRQTKKPRGIVPQGLGEGQSNGSVGAAQVDPQIIVPVGAAIIGQADQLVAVQWVDSLHASALLALAGRR